MLVFFKPEDTMFYEKHKGLSIGFVLLLMTLEEDWTYSWRSVGGIKGL